jgi:DNA-binding PucR family transcriptional regulator
VRARFSVNAVAEELGVHPNTVRYRLEQAGALLGRDLSDPEAQFELQLLLRLLGREGKLPVVA